MSEEDQKELEAYRSELSKVMPEDKKDWWQNSKSEWPEVARGTIESLKEEIEWYSSHLDYHLKKKEELEKEVAQLKKELERQKEYTQSALNSYYAIVDSMIEEKKCKSQKAN